MLPKYEVTKFKNKIKKIILCKNKVPRLRKPIYLICLSIFINILFKYQFSNKLVYMYEYLYIPYANIQTIIPTKAAFKIQHLIFVLITQFS